MAENSKETAKKPRGKPFPKGVSGNPGGRPPMPEELKITAQGFCPEVLQTWVTIMRNPDARDSDRIKAGENIMDRAYGKAPQHIDASMEGGIKITLDPTLKEWGQ